jgi:DNA-binding GntR family transcriptional regulator
MFSGTKTTMLTSSHLQKPHRTKEEYVYDTLRTAITRCELKPGEKLVIETLSSELGVSPIPIRSALQRLQAEGLVEITPHTGTIVSEISPNTVQEIFALLGALENVAVSAAASRVTAADIAQLRELVKEMESALQADDSNYWYDLNNKFHLTIAQITQMKMLIRFTSRALDSRDRLRNFYLASFVSIRMSEAQTEHCQMIDLLECCDIEALKSLVDEHNRRAQEAYQRLLKKQEAV